MMDMRQIHQSKRRVDVERIDSHGVSSLSCLANSESGDPGIRLDRKQGSRRNEGS
jgi:hypothetical protein